VGVGPDQQERFEWRKGKSLTGRFPSSERRSVREVLLPWKRCGDAAESWRECKRCQWRKL
jgi:hypothetical protein